MDKLSKIVDKEYSDVIKHVAQLYMRTLSAIIYAYTQRKYTFLVTGIHVIAWCKC